MGCFLESLQQHHLGLKLTIFTSYTTDFIIFTNLLCAVIKSHDFSSTILFSITNGRRSRKLLGHFTYFAINSFDLDLQTKFSDCIGRVLVCSVECFFLILQIFHQPPDPNVPLPQPQSRLSSRRSRAIGMSKGPRKPRSLYTPTLCLADAESEYQGKKINK